MAAPLQTIKTALFELTVKLAPDRLKLFVDAKPVTPTATVTRKELVSALKEVTKEELLELGVLDDIAERLGRGEACLDRRVAKGTDAVPGQDGRLALLVKPFTGKGAPKEMAQGRVDFRSLHLFDNISAGGIVGKIFPPAVGKDGLDATGKVIPSSPGKPVKISIDKTMRLERPPREELECVIANNLGYLFEDSGRLTIREELIFPSDIDLRTGSIDFIGSLVVNGDIAPGFFARGQRGVIVSGGIRDASVESKDGEVVIKGFAFGGPGAARVLAGGAVTINSAQELIVEARGDLRIEKHASDCVLRTHRSLSAPAASIVGGQVYAVCGGEIGELGNNAGKKTVVYLCNNVEADPSYTELLARISTHTKAISMIEGHLGPYAKNPARMQLLKQPFREKMEDLFRKLSALRKSLESLEANRTKALAGATKNDIQRVNVLQHAHPGVEISCEGETLTLKDAVAGPISIDFDPVTKKFTVGPLQALVCNIPAPGTSGPVGDKHERKK